MIGAGKWRKEMQSIRAYCRQLIRELRCVPKMSYFDDLKLSFASLETTSDHLIEVLEKNANQMESIDHLLNKLFKTT